MKVYAECSGHHTGLKNMYLSSLWRRNLKFTILCAKGVKHDEF